MRVHDIHAIIGYLAKIQKTAIIQNTVLGIDVILLQYYEKYWVMIRLVHDTGLAVTVSVGAGVELVTERRLDTDTLTTDWATGGSESRGVGVLAAESLANVAGLTLEAVVTLLTTSENTALLLKVAHAHSGEG